MSGDSVCVKRKYRISKLISAINWFFDFFCDGRLRSRVKDFERLCYTMQASCRQAAGMYFSFFLLFRQCVLYYICFILQHFALLALLETKSFLSLMKLIMTRRFCRALIQLCDASFFPFFNVNPLGICTSRDCCLPRDLHFPMSSLMSWLHSVWHSLSRWLQQTALSGWTRKSKSWLQFSLTSLHWSVAFRRRLHQLE